MNAVSDPERIRLEARSLWKTPKLEGELAGLTLIFFLAFGLRFWYNFIFPHINDYSAGDAWEYLTNAGALLSLAKEPLHFWRDCLDCLLGTAGHEAVAQLRQTLSPFSDMQITGLVFPSYLALCYLIAGSPFDPMHWAAPVTGQCLISSFMAVMVALTGKYAFDRKTGILAGLLCAVYPGFIVNTDRLYTETFAAFLISACSFLTVRGIFRKAGAAESVISGVLNGALAACLQFTRSVMAIFTFALIAMALWQGGWRRRVLVLTTLAFGFLIIAAPWLAFQKVAFGSSNLVVDRAGQHNVFIGNCVEGEGWLPFPYPNMAFAQTKSMPALLASSFLHGPLHWLGLTQSKPVRLLKHPWNDFQKPIGAFHFSQQVVFHQAVLLFAVFGIILGFARISGEAIAGRQLAARAFLLFVLAFQALYCLFITVPRYNLTAMPTLLLFAAAGVLSIVHLSTLVKGKAESARVIAAALLLFFSVHASLVPFVIEVGGPGCLWSGVILQSLLIFSVIALLTASLWTTITRLSADQPGDGKTARVLAMSASRILLFISALAAMAVLVFPAQANGRFLEWSAELQPGETAQQELRLPPDFSEKVRGRQCYLLIDSGSGSGPTSGAGPDSGSGAGMQSVEVAVDGKTIDAPRIPGLSLCDTFSRFQNLSGCFLREYEWIFTCLTMQAGIRGADLRQWIVMPVAADLLAGRSHVTISVKNRGAKEKAILYGSYDTCSRSVSIPSLALISWEKAFYGVENDSRFSDPRYTVRIPACYSVASASDLSSAPGAQTGRYNIHILAGPRTGKADNLASHEAPLADSIVPRPEVAVPPAATVMVPAALVRAPVHRVMAPADMVVPLTDSVLPTAVLTCQNPRLIHYVASPADFRPNDWWVVRVTADARAQSRASMAVDIAAICRGAGAHSSARTSTTRKWGDPSDTKPDTTKPYQSPWTSHRSLCTDWRHVDVSAPVVSSFGGTPVKDIRISFVLKDSEPGTEVIIKDLKVQILRLPADPLGPDYQVY